MPGKNGASPMPETSDAAGVFGRVGSTLPLGGRQVTVRILTNREIKAQQPLVAKMSYLESAGADPGHQFYEGAIFQEQKGPEDEGYEEHPWAALAAWLSAWCTEPVSEDDLLDAVGDDVILLINTIFYQSGLAWLRRQMGNAFAAWERRRAATLSPQRESSPTGTENSSTTSTTSSSTSPDRQPTPDPETPSTT